MRLIILTGMSGAGKMTAFRYFDDAGYYAVDNLPPSLLPQIASTERAAERERVVVTVDARSGREILDLPAILDTLYEQDTPAQLLYLDASDDVLVRRFKETRRAHPLFGESRGSVLDAIYAERTLLNPARARADKVIDTSSLTPSELGSALADFAGIQPTKKMQITVVSFGFKHGLPIDADLVFDVRFLTNPHYVAALKPLTGAEPEVARYIHQHPLTEPFLEKMFDFVAFSLPHYQREGKAYLTIAIGCTGGRHRSVTVAQDLADYLQVEGYRVAVFHRDLERENAPRGGRK